MSAWATPDPLRERNRRTAKFLIGWIVVVALASPRACAVKSREVATDVTPPRRDEVAIVDGLLADSGRIPPSPPSDDGDDGERPWREPERTPLVANAVLGMVMFLGAEAMFFAALVGAFLVLRLGAQVWPPPFQPRVPVEVTGVNSAILLLSGATMALALRAIGGDQAGSPLSRPHGRARAVFTCRVRGRGQHFGLRYPLTHATFYAGRRRATCSAPWLSLVLSPRACSRPTHVPVTLCGMFWFFVVFLWPVLYVLVYLR
jgi:cytochrome c oxidase subunit 3